MINNKNKKQNKHVQSWIQKNSATLDIQSFFFRWCIKSEKNNLESNTNTDEKSIE